MMLPINHIFTLSEPHMTIKLNVQNPFYAELSASTKSGLQNQYQNYLDGVKEAGYCN
jgi:hypothetical protein